jgi:hypothetical protein
LGKWKINVKIGVGPLKGPLLRGLLGAPKSAKKALCSSGINGNPDDLFRIPVTPNKIENHEDSILTTFF